MQKISKKNLSQYSALAIPLAFAGMPLYIHAPDFYATQYQMSLTTIGTILLAIRALDAIQDPLIGGLSDQYPKSRLTLMLTSTLILALGFIMLFHPKQSHLTLWFIVSMILATTAYSILTINLNTLGGVWAEKSDEKTKITTWREAISLIGLLIAASLPTLLQATENAKQAFSNYTIILVITLIICTAIFYNWFKHTGHKLINQQATPNSLSLIANLSIHKTFFSIYALSMFASAIPAVLVLFFIRDKIGAEEHAGIFLVLYFLSGIVGMPLWQKLAQYKNKKFAWQVAMSLAIATFVWAFFLKEGNIIGYAIVCFTSGVTLGAELALPPAILAELIQQKNQKAQASTLFAALTFASKCSLALASGIILSLLGLANYQPGTNNSPQALMALSVYYALIPCIIKSLSAICLYLWPYKDIREQRNEPQRLSK